MACRVVSAKQSSTPLLEYSYWTPRNKLQWNLNLNPYIFNQENAFESVVRKMTAILSWLKYVEFADISYFEAISSHYRYPTIISHVYICLTFMLGIERYILFGEIRKRHHHAVYHARLYYWFHVDMVIFMGRFPLRKWSVIRWLGRDWRISGFYHLNRLNVEIWLLFKSLVFCLSRLIMKNVIKRLLGIDLNLTEIFGI